ncbi:MAG TPA: hypothetical protein VF875_17725 [Anaeromyxobacter sp.]
MNGPAALGMVLAMLVDGRGKVVRGGAGRGQLYATRDGLVVLKPTARQEIFQRLMNGTLLLSIFVVVANVFTFKEPAALWIAVALQAIYWLSLPARRRALDPELLGDAALAEAARKRALVQVPADQIASVTPPEPPKRGFRKPARFVLADGALEVYLSEGQFRRALEGLGRQG